MNGALAEVDYPLGTLALDGVLLLTNTNGVYLGDGQLDAVFDELNRRAAVAFIHPWLPAWVERTSLGYAPPVIEFVLDTTRAVTHLIVSGRLDRCPDLRLIVPYAGGTLPFLADRMELLAARFLCQTPRRVPLLASKRIFGSSAISTSPHAVASVPQLVGPEHILFGSDWPALDEPDVESLIQAVLDNPLLQPSDLARIERQNALELFTQRAVAMTTNQRRQRRSPAVCVDPAATTHSRHGPGDVGPVTPVWSSMARARGAA